MTTSKLKYEKFNNADNVIAINLNNGYTVIAITGLMNKNTYTTTLFLKENTIDNWALIDNVNVLEFDANLITDINATLVNKISTLFSENFFDYYINRYEYELKCCEKGSETIEFTEFFNVS